MGSPLVVVLKRVKQRKLARVMTNVEIGFLA